MIVILGWMVMVVVVVVMLMAVVMVLLGMIWMIMVCRKMEGVEMILGKWKTEECQHNNE